MFPILFRLCFLLLLLPFLSLFQPIPPSNIDINCPPAALTTYEEVIDWLRASTLGIEGDEVMALLLGCTGHLNYTRKQLEDFLEKRGPTLSNVMARRVPLCLLTDDVKTSDLLTRYFYVFKALEEAEITAKITDPINYPLLPVADASKVTINIRRITIPDTIQNNMLHQWINVQITFVSSIEGILVQSVEGSLGIPFGEFRTDFDCYDEPPLPGTGTVPCRYRPRHSYRHPNIFVVGGTLLNRKSNNFSFHFNWHDMPCQEVVAFQFIVIALVNYNPLSPQDVEYEAFLTPVYELETPDTFDGAPTYYYPSKQKEWKEEVKCNADDPMNPPLNVTISTDAIIPYSRSYDRCITTDFSLDRKYGTCPPGPFFCPQITPPPSQTEWIEARRKKLASLKQCNIPRSKCKANAQPPSYWDHPKPNIPVWPPIRRRKKRMVASSTTQLPTSAPVLTSDELFMPEFEKLGVKHYKFNKRLHGLMMIISFLVINPVTMYLARYFKETPSICAFWGIPRWMVVHIILSFFSLWLMWLGIVASLGNFGRGVVDCTKLVSANNVKCEDHQNTKLHMAMGFVTVLAYHISAATGWSRPQYSRGMYMTTHSISGYFTVVGATICSVMVNASVCLEIKFEAIFLLLFTIIIFFIECGLQKIQDQRLGVQERPFFPMMEGIQVHEQSPPCHCMKICVFATAVVLHLTVGILVLLSYIVINDQDIYTDHSNVTESEFFVEGLFVKGCTVLNYEHLLEKARKKI